MGPDTVEALEALQGQGLRLRSNMVGHRTTLNPRLGNTVYSSH